MDMHDWKPYCCSHDYYSNCPRTNPVIIAHRQTSLDAKTNNKSYGNIFITGHKTKIVALKPDGTLLRKVATRGRGAKEYISVEDIALSADGQELMLLDDGRVLCHGINDTTSFREIKIQMPPVDAIAPAADGGVYLSSAFPAKPDDYGKPKPMLIHIDRNGETIGEYLPREDVTFSIGAASAQTVGQ